jgi:S-DNA-T family DNA segregation ATPase FtsK/SpoIIIE
MGHTANDMVLGTGAYKAGIRATMFSRSDRGICWMSGEGDDPVIAASAFVDGPAAELVVARARQLREDYGNITGHAIGEGPAESPRHGRPRRRPQGVPRRRGAAVVRADRRPPRRVLAGRLRRVDHRERRPRAEALGVATADVWGTTDDGKGTTKRGIKRADVAAAITRRDADRLAA